MNPSLTEPGMKYFINETLKQCHVFKENYNNYWMNISLAILFFSVIAIILFIK